MRTLGLKGGYVTQFLDGTAMDRAIGAVVGLAVGDALGAGYEFGPPVDAASVSMRPGVLTGEPAGHWTDDTAMAIAILEVAADLGTLCTDEAALAVGDRFLDWFGDSPTDIGHQTRLVLERGSRGVSLRDAALDVQRLDLTRAGNGSLMRTGPVALPHVGDIESMVVAARTMSALTHPNEWAVEACILWTLAVDHAIRTGELVGPSIGLSALPTDRQVEWSKLLGAAEAHSPESFTPNGYVVAALQAAWSAIYATRDSDQHYSDGVRRAVSIGDDTDTIAAIAGSLLGACYGVSAVPTEWRLGLAGWPRGYRDADLIMLARRAVER